MTKRYVTRATGDYARGFAVEDGKNIRVEHQELGPAMRRVEAIKEAQAHKGTGQFDRRYIGSVPMTVLWDWLKERKFSMNDWATNAGGSICPPGADPLEHCVHDNGVKSQFLRYFLSRDFAKLHTQHTTTRDSKIWVPGSVDSDNKLRRTEDGDS